MKKLILLITIYLLPLNIAYGIEENTLSKLETYDKFMIPALAITGMYAIHHGYEWYKNHQKRLSFSNETTMNLFYDNTGNYIAPEQLSLDLNAGQTAFSAIDKACDTHWWKMKLCIEAGFFLLFSRPLFIQPSQQGCVCKPAPLDPITLRYMNKWS